MNESNLLFIVSQPRSGSTLLQALISNNPQVETTSEPWLALPFLSILKEEIQLHDTNSQLARFGIKEYLSKVDNEQELWNQSIGLALLNLYGALKTDKVKYVLDKTPRYYEILPELKATFPNAKYIILKRNPLAVLNSIIDTWIKEKSLSKLFTYNRDILDAPFLLDESSKQPGNNTYVVEYDNIAKSPLHSMPAIYSWLGIEFSEEYLDYAANDKYKGSLGDSEGIRKHSKPHSQSIDEWKYKLNDPFWGDFFKGYIDYLGAEFLSNYCNLEVENTQPTKMFDYFISRYQTFNHASKLPLKYHIKLRLIDKIRYSKWLKHS